MSEESPKSGATRLVDIEELVRNWVDEFPVDKNISREKDDILPTDISWKHFRVTHGETKYSDQSRGAAPKSHVLFTAHFTNSTDQPQIYTLKTERRTKSTCSVNVKHGYTYGVSMSVSLTPPNPIVSANVGFKGELMVEKSSNNTVEEEIVWSVDNQISVPAQYKTRADLVIKEDEYDGTFQTESRFEGKIHVTLRNKKDNSPLTTLTGNVANILKQNKGFRHDKSGVYFTTIGTCKCRFGIEQHVSLKQSKVEDEREPEPVLYATMDMSATDKY